MGYGLHHRLFRRQSLIEQLETAFHNRIEFRSSDGTDPYTPTQAMEAPTQETFWVTEPPTVPPVTEPPVTVPVYTEPATLPTAAPTVPAQTAPPATQPTIVLATEVANPQPYQGGGSTGSGIFGLLIVVIVLAILATGALLVHTASRGKRRRRRR